LYSALRHLGHCITRNSINPIGIHTYLNFMIALRSDKSLISALSTLIILISHKKHKIVNIINEKMIEHDIAKMNNTGFLHGYKKIK